MLDVSEITHPATPPSWLPDWPSPAAIDSQYSVVMRRIGLTLAMKLTNARIDWSDNTIRAFLGSQMCSWSRNAAGWTRRCTCGAPPDRCPHAYMTCLLLQKIFIAEGWQKASSAGANPRPAMPAPRPASTFRPQQLEFQLTQPARPAQPGFFLDSKQPQELQHKLEVEVDFRHEAGMATLRFYDCGSGQRELMRLCTLHTIGYNVAHNGGVPGWPEQDGAFIAYALPAIVRIPWNMRNATVLKLRRKEFAGWQSRWASSPQRFIERESQQFLQISDITIPVDLKVELVPEDDYIRFNASFVLPNGTSLPVHEYFAKLQADPEKDSLTRQLKEYKPPIDWPVLYRHFSEHPPRMKRSLVAAHVKELVNGRLDILCGPCVKINRTQRDKTEIYASADNGQFSLAVLFDGVPIPLDTAVNEKATIRDTGNAFVVTLPNDEAIAEARQCLANMPFPVTRETTRISFPQYSANAQAFRQFWQALPPSVRKNCSGKLKPLLEKSAAPAAITPVVCARQEGPLAWLDVRFSIDGQLFDRDTLATAAAKKQATLRAVNGTWLEVSPEAIQRALAETGGDELCQKLSGVAVLAKHAAQSIRQLQDALGAQLADDTASFVKRLALEPPPELPAVAPELDAVLRSYQKDGILFMLDRAACGVGAILADDMGLGKTLQVLATLDAWKRHALAQGKSFRALVVCPASVMHVWQQQAAQFCPGLSTVQLRGTPPQRARILDTTRADVIITHYQLARMDKAQLETMDFDFLILDEAQAVKNPEAQVTLAIRALSAEHAIAVTGTPLENSLQDLWSIMSCINPGFLGSLEHFLDCHNSRDGLAALHKKLKPLILRRTKRMVAQELPPRTEQIITLEMPPEQQEIYDRELALAKISVKGKGPDAILGALTRLREICCHPMLVHPEAANQPSIKLERLLEQIATLNASGHSTLVFSQFTSMLDVIRQAMDQKAMPSLTITGATPLPQRQKLVQQFTDSPAPLNFLLSLKAAGTGLTLTKADYVFLFDPWWNPAVEQQAIDRTHRIGQTSPVVAYKYVAAGTIEEKVLALLAAKRELFNAVMDSDESGGTAVPGRLSLEELRSLIE